MIIKKYENFILESNDLDDSDKSVMDELKSLIDKTIEKSGGEYKVFIESYLKDQESVKINGLINDSDIYEFYLKFRNPIDKSLNEIKFYDEIPSELNVFGLYDYIISGTMRSVADYLKKMI